MERQRMGYDQRRAGIDSPEEAFAPDGANRGETEPGGVSELVDQPWWEGGSTHDEADDDKPRDAGGARQATPEPHKSRPGGYMYRGLTYGAAASEPEPGAASSGDDEPPDEAVLAIMSEEPAGGPAAGEGAQADPALDSPWWREGARPVDAAAQAPGAGEDEEERPGLAVSVPAGYGGPASEPEPGAAASGGGDEPPEEAGAAAVPEERAEGPAAEEGAQADPALDSPWRREGSRPVDAAPQAPGAGEDEEERPGPAVSVPAGYGGPASEPEPGAAASGGGDEPPEEAGAAAVPEERVEGPAAEEGAQADPALDSPPWWREGAWPVDAAAQALGAGDDEEELPGPAVSMPAGYGGLASEPEPGAAASGGGDAPPEEAGAAVVPEKPAGGPAVEERAPAEPAMDSPSWGEDSPGDAAGQASGSGDHGEEGEAPDRVHPASPAGLPQAPEGPADVPPVELIRSIVAEVCPDELLLVDTTEGPMPEWAHAAVTAARNDLARRSAERRAVDAGEFLRLAIVEHIMGLHEDADGHLKEALPQSERFGPVLNALAVANLALGKIAPAIVYCKEALRETDGDDAVRAAASSNLGDLYRLQGNASQAAEAYEAAIQSFGSQEEAHGLPRLHFHAGCLYRHLGETDKARAHLSESVRLYKESGDEPGHIRALGTLGLALNDAGLHDLALRSLEEGVRICLRTGDKPGAALVQDGMGLVYMSQGQLTRSLAYLESALSLHRELGDREGEAATRDNIGKIHHSRGEPATRPQESVDREKAPSRFLEAEEILRRAGSAELQEKHEAVDPNARAGNARLG